VVKLFCRGNEEHRQVDNLRLRGAIYLSLAASIWGGMYVVSKYVLDYIPPLTLLVMRLVIAGAILGGAMLWRRESQVRRHDVALLLSLGLVGFTLSLGLQFWGTKLSSAHNGGLITSASPAFIVLFAVYLLRERLTWQNLVALGLATLGVLAVVGPESGGSSQADHGLWLGNLYLVGAAVTWALYTVLGKLASQSYSSLTVSTYATLSGLLFTTPLAWWTEWRGWVLPADLPILVWLGVAYVGVISTAVAFYLWVRGFALLDAATGSLFFFAQPLVAALLGALLLGETLHWYFYVGAGLILTGLTVSALGSARRDRVGRTAIPEPVGSGDALPRSEGVPGPHSGGHQGAR
jgi:drug/metabolite transporter (DMT)-like permease